MICSFARGIPISVEPKATWAICPIACPICTAKSPAARFFSKESGSIGPRICPTPGMAAEAFISSVSMPWRSNCSPMASVNARTTLAITGSVRRCHAGKVACIHSWGVQATRVVAVGLKVVTVSSHKSATESCSRILCAWAALVGALLGRREVATSVAACQLTAPSRGAKKCFN